MSRPSSLCSGQAASGVLRRAHPSGWSPVISFRTASKDRRWQHGKRVLRVFVASPSDVGDARKCLERIVNDLNYTWSRRFGLRLELVRWETHAWPGVGEDAQDVISQELDDDYDIFLGIMWKTFGTPTGRARSGTEEEYDRARRRYDANPKALRMMFYFREVRRPTLGNVDQKQLRSVRQFQRKLERSGMLVGTYKTLRDFERKVQQHLTRQIQEWGTKWGGVISEPADQAAVSLTRDEVRDGIGASVTEDRARSITAIVFDGLTSLQGLMQRPDHDPEEIQKCLLAAQAGLDHSRANDAWGRLAAQQAAALVAVALAGRLVANEAAQDYVTQVCQRIVGLRGLQIRWGAQGRKTLYGLLTKATDRLDDDVLLWIKRHTRKKKPT